MADGVVMIPFPGQPLACGSASTTALGEFYAGPENRLVEPAVESVLVGLPNPFNPLVFYGASGTGKSHLARGLAAVWMTRYPSAQVVYATAIDFARELADAIDTHAVDDFRARYRTAGLAVFENLGELIGKQAAQEELIQTLDALSQQGAQIIVTAPAAPLDMNGLAVALVSRLSEGLTVPLTPPGPDARLAIVERWATLRGLELSGRAVRLLADEFEGTVPELLGAMLQLEVRARQDDVSIDLDAVRSLLAERNTDSRPALRDIALAAARYFSLKLGELRGSSRRRPIVVARDVAMLVARQLTRESLQRIGHYFGGRDHTTVLHACRKTEELVQTDPTVRQAVEQLHERILAR